MIQGLAGEAVPGEWQHAGARLVRPSGRIWPRCDYAELSRHADRRNVGGNRPLTRSVEVCLLIKARHRMRCRPRRSVRCPSVKAGHSNADA